MLLTNGAKPNLTDFQGNVALSYVNNSKMFSILMQSGADYRIKNKQGNTPLMYALESKKTDDSAFLSIIGASTFEDLLTTNENGENAFLIACKHRPIYVLEYILRKANTSLATSVNYNKETALHIAIKYSNLSIFRFL